MLSLDDSIVTRQNLILLDNLTNYDKSSIDYFHYKFAMDGPDVPLAWTILLRMKSHRVLRLPSCAMEDDQDYTDYLMRLHHCLWRRWSLHYFDLAKNKQNPLDINWNKESDVNVLYGPDLTGYDDLFSFNTDQPQSNSRNKNKRWLRNYCASKDNASVLAASGTSCSMISTLFDSGGITEVRRPKKRVYSTTTRTMATIEVPREIKFVDSVLRREIDEDGIFRETKVLINDTSGKLSDRPSHSIQKDGVYVVHHVPHLYDDRYLIPYTPDEDPLELDFPKTESSIAYTEPNYKQHRTRRSHHRSHYHQKSHEGHIENVLITDVVAARGF
ncbi:uncharacterized protein RNJ42_01080 [Nakaseomyces bracarensis]|uniref:uncharacterized protein n=1 Tax=Nakaseomyces bracarensis TaxID=273131 RepID=UPI0038729941